MIGVATATFVLLVVLVFAARRLGNPLAPWIPPTLFIMSFGLLQPKPPGTVGRPLQQRVVFSLVVGAVAGVLLWAIDSGGW